MPESYLTLGEIRMSQVVNPLARQGHIVFAIVGFIQLVVNLSSGMNSGFRSTTPLVVVLGASMFSLSSMMLYRMRKLPKHTEHHG